LGLHPEWPFPGLGDKYSCPGIPEGIVASIVDRNGHCVWLAYAQADGTPDAVAALKTYDTDYERGLRAVFFDTFRSYPRQVIETFLYYKPKYTIQHIGSTFSPERFHATRSVAALVLLQIVLVLVFIGVQRPPMPMRDAARQTSVLFLFFVPALIPQFFAWTVPGTALDLFVYLWSGFIIICWMIIAYAFRLVAASKPLWKCH